VIILLGRNGMADDSRNFWTVFEEAKQETKDWPKWKKDIRVGIYSETPEAFRPALEKQKNRSAKK
jgi:hypothetical protein